MNVRTLQKAISPPLLPRSRQQFPRIRVLLVLVTRVSPEITFSLFPTCTPIGTPVPNDSPRPPTASPRHVLVIIQRRRCGRERRLQRHPHRFAACHAGACP